MTTLQELLPHADVPIDLTDTVTTFRYDVKVDGVLILTTDSEDVASECLSSMQADHPGKESVCRVTAIRGGQARYGYTVL